MCRRLGKVSNTRQISQLLLQMVWWICWCLIYSSLHLCNVSCANGCNTTPKHDWSTPMLNNWQGVLFMTYYCWLWWRNIPSVHSTCFLNASGLFRCSIAYFWSRILLMRTQVRFPSTDSPIKVHHLSWVFEIFLQGFFVAAYEQFSLRVFLVFQILPWPSKFPSLNYILRCGNCKLTMLCYLLLFHLQSYTASERKPWLLAVCTGFKEFVKFV